MHKVAKRGLIDITMPLKCGTKVAMQFGLTLDSMTNRGVASAGVERLNNDFKLAEEPAKTNRSNASTEKYQQIGRHLVGYGRF